MNTSPPAMVSAGNPVMPFSQRLEQSGLHPLVAQGIEVLQINVGRRCNLSCRHCHLECGPHRTEEMSRTVFERVLEIAADPSITTIDITGGAPEMNPELPWFINQGAALRKRLIVRSNLVVLLDKPYNSCIDLYASNRVELVGSLPNMHEEKNDRQRGPGAFTRTIAALRQLNARGYAHGGTGLILDLVHNPVGAFLPGSQTVLELEYKRALMSGHGIMFNRLFCLTNNPTGRYRAYLHSSGNYEEYMTSLADAYNPQAACNVMCRTTLSVGWDGALYDCDFNQALGMTVNHGAPRHIDRFEMSMLKNREIIVGDHCYACTAGSGSSCQGATDQ